MTTLTPAQPAAAAGGRFWAWLPALLLVSLLGTQLVVLQCVLADPGFALESDYYRKAVAWDEQRALQRQSQALGWQLRLETRAAAAGTHVRLWLGDAPGAAVQGARVRVSAFANARAAQRHELELTESQPGWYEADLRADAHGLWELRVEATRGAQHFRQVVRQSLAGSRGQP
jgi:nitrogen fixation protein FixH